MLRQLLSRAGNYKKLRLLVSLVQKSKKHSSGYNWEMSKERQSAHASKSNPAWTPSMEAPFQRFPLHPHKATYTRFSI